MSKPLIIPAHPDISQSTVNKHWTTAIKQHPDSFTVHELYTVYPRGKIDVSAEEKLIESPDAPVLQFPVYRFNCPPLLKQCLDEVLHMAGHTAQKARLLQAESLRLPLRSVLRLKTTARTVLSDTALPKFFAHSNSLQNTAERTTDSRLPSTRLIVTQDTAKLHSKQQR